MPTNDRGPSFCYTSCIRLTWAPGNLAWVFDGGEKDSKRWLFFLGKINHVLQVQYSAKYFIIPISLPYWLCMTLVSV